jgi:multiple antibiotic resistance protein
MISEMRHVLEAAVLVIASMLPIINPLAGAPVFLIKTGDLDDQQRGYVAMLVARNSFVLLLASILVGAYVLDFLALSVDVVRVAGGLVVCAVAWQLLNQQDSPARGASEAVRTATPDDLALRAFYPLTLPLTVGPGSISVAITLGANQPVGVRQLILTLFAHALGVVIVALVIYFSYRYANRLLGRLGRTGTSILIRLSAFILLCIGVQITWNGLSALLGIHTAA